MLDTELRRHVLDELDFDPSLDARNIGVTVQNAIVTLAGHVGSYAEKYNAERATQRVKGVRGIVEEIAVRVPSSALTDDGKLAKRAADVIAWDASLPPDAVKVKVQNGWVTLSGTVDWQYQRTACESAVRRLSGVVGVANLIAIKPHLSAVDVKASIDRALQRSAEIESRNITLDVSGGAVTLQGGVQSWHERDAAQRAAWSVPGVTSVVNRLIVG